MINKYILYIYNQSMVSRSLGKARLININLKISSYIIVKLLKTREKEKILKVVSGKEKYRLKNQLTGYFSIELTCH